MRHAGDACPRHAADEQGLSLACRNTQLKLDTKGPVLEPNQLQMHDNRLPRSCHRLLLSTIVPRKKQSLGTQLWAPAEPMSVKNSVNKIQAQHGFYC